MLGGLNNDFVLWMVFAALGFSILTLVFWAWRLIVGYKDPQDNAG